MPNESAGPWACVEASCSMRRMQQLCVHALPCNTVDNVKRWVCFENQLPCAGMQIALVHPPSMHKLVRHASPLALPHRKQTYLAIVLHPLRQLARAVKASCSGGATRAKSNSTARTAQPSGVTQRQVFHLAQRLLPGIAIDVGEGLALGKTLVAQGLLQAASSCMLRA